MRQPSSEVTKDVFIKLAYVAILHKLPVIRHCRKMESSIGEFPLRKPDVSGLNLDSPELVNSQPVPAHRQPCLHSLQHTKIPLRLNLCAYLYRLPVVSKRLYYRTKQKDCRSSSAEISQAAQTWHTMRTGRPV